ncbi:4'-phosphopantetheinyl transferase superfamily protein [Streptomyces sp. NBC_00091]|uniref:4'-phosphopantetheinyl transferase superfamily protein n=1 Tax=Streptomyces sp. NBC_00091 TaxID=2975648 RepID=UPI0022560271|nr:4'-phosphopantetheinyl transferase superfamily protein [Streptomyces sp. NBC_00091]MCX5375088.1 4'-phosphopantetheinyl transferase superfamily protein [Streptomyces sp. NBC_00091]
MPTRPVAAPPAGGLGWANLGMDIVSVTRVRRLLRLYGEDFFQRMLTPGELADCRTSAKLDILSLCGRIAAKEAAFKTLRVRAVFLPWRDIIVRRSEGGWPLVELHRSAAAMAAQSGIAGITVTISHDVDYAVAVAAPVLEAGPPALEADPPGHPVPPELPGPAAASGADAASVPSTSSTHRTSRRDTMSEGLQLVKNWLLARHEELEDIAPDLDLIENRLIDSLSFVEFVFLLEQHSGRSIQLETLEVDEIRTLDAIKTHFFTVQVGQA